MYIGPLKCIFKIKEKQFESKMQALGGLRRGGCHLTSLAQPSPLLPAREHYRLV